LKIESSKTNPADCRKEAAQLSVVYRDISELKLDPRNPRHHSERQIIQIARSIEVFGFNVPILIDRDGNVIAGHGRLLACKKLGFRKVATIGLDHPTRAQIRAFMIADNRLTENSEWDERLLAQALKDLSLLNLDFSLEDTGFEMGEIDFRIQGLEGNQETGEDPGDALPQSSIPAVSRPGDLWMLDKNLVYCGSALDARAYTLLFGSERASMVITDQPFNLRIEDNVSGLGAICHRNFAMASGEMDEAEFTEFLTSSCSLMAKYSVDGSIHFLFMDWRHMTEMLNAGREIYTELKNLCVWTKNHTGMGAFYRSRHELVFVFKNGRGSHRNNIQLGRYGRDRTNV
jgi:ParB-like nuclease domain